MGETSQTASGTLSVFAYLRLRHAKGRDAVFGQLRKERRDRDASEAGSGAGRETSQLEQLHRGGQSGTSSVTSVMTCPIIPRAGSEPRGASAHPAASWPACRRAHFAATAARSASAKTVGPTGPSRATTGKQRSCVTLDRWTHGTAFASGTVSAEAARAQVRGNQPWSSEGERVATLGSGITAVAAAQEETSCGSSISIKVQDRDRHYGAASADI